MKTTISNYDFERAFVDAGRQDQFSYEARGLLFDYLEQLEDSIGEEIELDVIAICCEYSEETTADIARYYPIDLAHLDAEDAEDEDYEERCNEAVRRYLEGNTTLVGETATGFVFAQF